MQTIRDSFIRIFDYVSYCDGCCEPVNPCGNMGIGSIIYKVKSKEVVFKHADYFQSHKDNSNNVAEYLALISVLDFFISEELTKSKILILGDSKLFVMQMSGEWKIKGGRYVPYANEAKEKKKKLLKPLYRWIPREQNATADELSKSMLIKNNVEFRIQPR